MEVAGDPQASEYEGVAVSVPPDPLAQIRRQAGKADGVVQIRDTLDIRRQVVQGHRDGIGRENQLDTMDGASRKGLFINYSHVGSVPGDGRQEAAADGRLLGEERLGEAQNRRRVRGPGNNKGDILRSAGTFRIQIQPRERCVGRRRVRRHDPNGPEQVGHELVRQVIVGEVKPALNPVIILHDQVGSRMAVIAGGFGKDEIRIKALPPRTGHRFGLGSDRRVKAVERSRFHNRQAGLGRVPEGKTGAAPIGAFGQNAKYAVLPVGRVKQTWGFDQHVRGGSVVVVVCPVEVVA